MDTETDYTILPFEKRAELLKENATKFGIVFNSRIVVTEQGIFSVPGISDAWEKKDVSAEKTPNA